MMRRDQRTVSVGTSSTQLLGPNPRRKGVVIAVNGDLLGNQANATQVASVVDTSTTGIKQSITLPGTQSGLCNGASAFSVAVSGVVSRLQLVRSAVTYTVMSVSTSGTYVGSLPLSAGDTLQWNVTTAQPASTTDYTISIVRQTLSSRVTISVNSPAVLDQGINVVTGADPLVLWEELLGDAITEGLYAIGAQGTIGVTVWDLFG